MDDYHGVSLGFAEFVAQLLHETFDAVLGAHAYQQEKLAELAGSLELTDDQFCTLHVGEAELREKEITCLGVALVEGMPLTAASRAAIQRVVPALEDDLPTGGVLSSTAFEVVRRAVIHAIVEEKRRVISAAVNKSELVRLVVDSGEIRAKLELSSLYRSPEQIPGQPEKPTPGVPPPAGKPPVREARVGGLTAGGVTSASSPRLKIVEITDPVSNRKTILVDRSSREQRTGSRALTQQVRIVATPAPSSSSSSLFSEVVIRFRIA